MGILKTFIKRRRRLWDNRNANNCISGCINRIYRFTETYIRCICSNARKKCNANERDKKFGLLKDIRGSVTSIELLIYIPIICFILFNGVDYYLTSVQHNNLENRKNYYLDVMRIEGTFSGELEAKIVAELGSMGLTNITIEATKISGGTDVPVYSDEYVYRNVNKPEEARMKLIIEAVPKFKPFIFGRLLGVNEGDDFKFVVKGEALSEKPYFEIEETP